MIQVMHLHKKPITHFATLPPPPPNLYCTPPGIHLEKKQFKQVQLVGYLTPLERVKSFSLNLHFTLQVKWIVISHLLVRTEKRTYLRIFKHQCFQQPFHNLCKRNRFLTIAYFSIQPSMTV